VLTILAVEGYVLYRQFDVYYGQAATSDAAGFGAAVPGERTLQESSVPEEAPKEKTTA